MERPGKTFVLSMAMALWTGAPPAGAADLVGYLGSGACIACHSDAAEAWASSHHALAWTLPTPLTVHADFDGTVFEHDGMTARFSIGEDGGYRVSVTEKNGVETGYPVHSVVGTEPLQQYLLETEPGRLQSFDVVWDTEVGGWFHLYPDQDLPPDDGLHWTGPYKTWNARCAECHATGFEKNYDPRTRRYNSTQVEMGVGCEACHGPGERHVAWAEAGVTREPPRNYGFAVDFSDRAAAIQQCATCHSRREAHAAESPVPGTPYHQSYALALLRPGVYHADGQILDEVFVYGSFLQSKMYARGVECGDCHTPHGADLVAEGNAVCTQCHSPAGNPRFETLKPADYDSPAHHFHDPGMACVSCHMVERVYMGNDWRADHSFRIPRPDLSEATGAGDACTDCHEDRTPEWAAAEIAAWYPDSDNRGPHYGQVFAEARSDAVSAAGDLEALAADPAQPGIVRATALWLLGQSNSPRAAERLAPLLADPDPLVRASAAGLQRLAPPGERLARLADALADPVRSVRQSAALALLDTPAMPGDPAAEGLRRALAEWQAALASRLDFPETHLQIAGAGLTMRNFRGAAAAFREAVLLDPQRVEAWVMLTRIAAATEGPAAARRILDEALGINPGDPELTGLLEDLGG